MDLKPIEGLKRALPWWAKIAAKLVLARLPVPKHTWQRLGLFSPGSMLDADYAIEVFDSHYLRAKGLRPGFSYLELGPGDSLATAIVARARGAAGGWLVDAGAYASRSPEIYRTLIAKLETADTRAALAPLTHCTATDDMLAAAGCTYVEDGLESLKNIPDNSVDFVFSQATLEHVAKQDFAETCRQLHRIHKPGSYGSHHIDFKDHLGGSLQSLRFSEALWEAPWFARRSGFYTNRLRLSHVIAHFEDAGFSVEVILRKRWPQTPMGSYKYHREFAALTLRDILTREALLRLRKDGGP